MSNTHINAYRELLSGLAKITWWMLLGSKSQTQTDTENGEENEIDL